jgi:pSer/pThr/pTyr-binding forkhead associated (FHA) protein
MEAKLVVVGGEAKTGEVKLKLPAVVGRSHEADVRLSHPLVSRKHCEFSEVDGMLFVKDLGSLNGTFIADNRITESVLKPNELITIGPVIFRAVYNGRVSDDLEAEPVGDLKAVVGGKKTVRLRDTKEPTETVSAKDDDDFDFTTDDGLSDVAETLPDMTTTAELEIDDLEFDFLSDDKPAKETKAKEPEKKEPAKKDTKSAAAAKPKKEESAEEPLFEEGASLGDDLDDIDFDFDDDKKDKKAAAATGDDLDDIDFDFDDDADKKKKKKAGPADDEDLDDFLKGLGLE